MSEIYTVSKEIMALRVGPIHVHVPQKCNVSNHGIAPPPPKKKKKKHKNANLRNMDHRQH